MRPIQPARRLGACSRQALGGAPAALAAFGVLGSLLAPTLARGQEVGFRAGLTSASISFSPAMGGAPLPPAGRRTGFVGGAIVFLPTTSRGGWQLEAFLHQKGARDFLRAGDEITLTYLDLPFLAHVDVFQADTRAVYLILGPSLAINLHSAYTDAEITDDPRLDVRALDLGFIAGGGVEYHHLIVDARYTWGLRNALEDTGREGAFRHRTFSATAGVRLRW